MSSVRNNPVSATSQEAILDAAREVILSVGWSRATLTDIAGRAGVSRMTVYRHWSDTRAVFADLMTREWTLTLGGGLAATPTEGIDALTGLTDSLVTTIELLRNNELLTRIIELDPELLLPYLLERPGRSQLLLSDVITGQIKAGQKDGSIRPGNATTLARSLLLAAHGFTLSAHTMGETKTFDRELRLLVQGYLKP